MIDNLLILLRNLTRFLLENFNQTMICGNYLMPFLCCHNLSYLSKINHTRGKLIPSFLDGVPKECRHGIKIWSAQEKKHKNPCEM